MWKWSCPASPLLVWEHHSFKSLNESLTAHENGFKVPGFRSFPACGEIHDYWDDGKPCGHKASTGRECRIPYIPDPDGPDEDVV